MANTTTSKTTTKIPAIVKGRGNRNMTEILTYHLKTKRFIGGLAKLEKDGTLTKLNGQIFDVRTTKNGLSLVLIDNFLGKKRPNQSKRWQAVLAKNLVEVVEHGWKHQKIS
jgi:hypothetical protein